MIFTRVPAAELHRIKTKARRMAILWALACYIIFPLAPRIGGLFLSESDRKIWNDSLPQNYLNYLIESTILFLAGLLILTTFALYRLVRIQLRPTKNPLISSKSLSEAILDIEPK